MFFSPLSEEQSAKDAHFFNRSSALELILVFCNSTADDYELKTLTVIDEINSKYESTFGAHAPFL